MSSANRLLTLLPECLSAYVKSHHVCMSAYFSLTSAACLSPCLPICLSVCLCPSYYPHSYLNSSPSSYPHISPHSPNPSIHPLIHQRRCSFNVPIRRGWTNRSAVLRPRRIDTPPGHYINSSGGGRPLQHWEHSFWAEVNRVTWLSRGLIQHSRVY